MSFVIKQFMTQIRLYYVIQGNFGHNPTVEGGFFVDIYLYDYFTDSANKDNRCRNYSLVVFIR